MISQIKKVTYELNNLYNGFRVKANYYLNNKFFKLFIVVIMVFPIIFLATRHYINSTKIKIIVKERQKVEDSLHVFKLPIASTHIN